METINKRNTDTFEKSFKELNDKVYKQQEQITGLNNTISMLYQKILELEQKYILKDVTKMTGLGPSVRE